MKEKEQTVTTQRKEGNTPSILDSLDWNQYIPNLALGIGLSTILVVDLCKVFCPQVLTQISEDIHKLISLLP